MNNKQKLAIVAPLVLIGVMYPIFRWTPVVFGETVGWYLGLVIYWILWGAIFPVVMLGKGNIKTIISPQKLNFRVFLFVLFPILMASLYQLVPGMGYEKSNFWIFMLFLSTAFGNGFFEEVFWRGIYMKLFPNNILFRIIWPSILFALWHYIPGSVHSDGNVIALIIGAGIFGFYLSFLAKRTETIWWSIIAHTISGLVMVI